MPESQRFHWFDLFRGLSALAVCASHLRNAMLVDFQQLARPSIVLRAFYFVTHLGHQAVMIFFVLSGFFVGGAILKRADRFTFSDYLAARLSRLWTVLIPALIFTAGVDYLLGMSNPELLQGHFREMSHSGPPADGSYSHSLLTFLGNLFFMQTVLAPTFGTLDPVWSLANEFWYYVCFPLLLVSASHLTAYRTLKVRLLASVLLVALGVLLPAKLWLGFVIWLIGAGVWLLAAAQCRPGKPKILWLPATTIFMASLGYSLSDGLQKTFRFPADLLVGLTFAFLAWIMLDVGFPSTPRALERLALGTSEFSYSLYLFHFPVVMLIVTYVYHCRRLQPDLSGILQFAGWFGVLCLIGFLSWFCFERHTGAIRRAFGKRRVQALN